MDSQPNFVNSLPPIPCRPVTARPDPLEPGAPCLNCGQGKLDYNGLLELECTACGTRFNTGGGYT